MTTFSSVSLVTLHMISYFPSLPLFLSFFYIHLLEIINPSVLICCDLFIFWKVIFTPKCLCFHTKNQIADHMRCLWVCCSVIAQYWMQWRQFSRLLFFWLNNDITQPNNYLHDILMSSLFLHRCRQCYWFHWVIRGEKKKIVQTGKVQ